MWKQGNFKALLEEGRTIQGRLQPNRGAESAQISQRFTEPMGKGKVKEATGLISDGGSAKVLPMNDQVDKHRTVYDVLLEKHPAGGELQQDIDSKPTGRRVHPVIFEITGLSIMEAALHTEGSAGPSGLDAYAWKRMCSSFKKLSTDLCTAVAMTARRMAGAFVDPGPLAPLTACRLVALDKSPGVRPVEVGEVVRMIISKSILSVIRPEIRAVVGSSQMCIGQKCGNEAAVHALSAIYEEESMDGVLLVDAFNAFNCLNRKAALANVNNLCPALGTVLKNTYRSEPKLFIDGECIPSREGTTQGDPLTVAMYAMATLPLIQSLQREVEVDYWMDGLLCHGLL